MINVEIRDEFSTQIEAAILITTAEAALKTRPDPSPCELTIVIENDETIQVYNLQYRGVDAPTDVLSFSSDEIDPETGNLYLGDILISLPRAQVQALVAGHTLEAETQLLVVHGVLHLLGYDHAEESEKQAMWQLQAQILTKIGCQILRLPESE
jgi:probable rRNA maturation factor